VSAVADVGGVSPQGKLLSDLKVTAGCRFNASARLRRRDKSSNVLVSVYSALLICISVATFALPLGSNVIRYASFGGIVASILLLVMSMKNFAHQFAVEAEQMHRCALEINELRRLMLARIAASGGLKSIEDYSKTYNAILQKWSVNHTEEDYLRYKYKHKWEFPDIADIPDKDLNSKMFQEHYDISATGVAILTVIGVALICLVGFFIWDSISTLNEPDSNVVIEQTIQNIMDSANQIAEQRVHDQQLMNEATAENTAR
jgi:hypothetical protein